MTYTRRDRRLFDAQRIVQHIAFGPMMFQAAVALRDLGVLAALERDDSTPPAVAERTKLPLNSVRVLLEAGESMGLCVSVDGRYGCTAAGRLMLIDEMTRVNVNFVRDVNYAGSAHLQEALTEARPAGLSVFGDWPTIYDAVPSLPPQTQDSWYRFDQFYSDRVFPLALPEVLAARPKRLLDVGGNTGKWAIACLRHDPDLRVTIVDLPGQLRRAREAARVAGVDDRLDTVERNVLDRDTSFPHGFDVVWMSQFLVCFAESDIARLLEKARQALAPEGRLYILETFWDRQPNEIARYCLHATSIYFACMANGTSRMYHSQDLLACIARAGLRLTHDMHLGLSHTLLSCAGA